MTALFARMTCRRRWLAALLIALACAGCSLPAVKDAGAPPDQAAIGKGAKEFNDGVKSYEDGEYQSAARQFQAALDRGLNAPGDRAKAHKYLAFIQCIAGKERLCRDEFKKALELNPNMELDPAEAGHPIWGPVFKSAKGKKPDAKK